MRISPFVVALSLAVAFPAEAGVSIASAAQGGEADIVVGDPTDVYGDYLSARFAADHHDLDEASKFYRASLDGDPNNPQLLVFAFFYAASAGHIDEAAELANRLAAVSPADRAVRSCLRSRPISVSGKSTPPCSSSPSSASTASSPPIQRWNGRGRLRRPTKPAG